MFNFIISFILVFYASFSFANLAYITNEKDNTVSVIDISIFQHRSTVQLGDEILELPKYSLKTEQMLTPEVTKERHQQ